MARPFAHTFEKDQSPLSPQSTSPSTPISYKTNVNRQKTKKWAEAKPIDYGGDDWGDEDEYDAPEPHQPPPLPVSKPTGLRQAGQGVPGGLRTDSPVSDVSKKVHGELPPLPGASNTTRPRANSFDPEDEHRNFSNSTMRQPSPIPAQVPPTRVSQTANDPTRRGPSGHPPLSITTNPSAPGVQHASQLVSPRSDSSSPHPDILLPGRKATGGPSSTGFIVSPLSETRSPTGDLQGRLDYSPSAVPQPLVTRTSIGPHATGADSQSKIFPARKSSLSQSIGPDVSEFAPEMAPSKPWAGGRSSSPGAAARAPAAATSPPKVPTFIRPADIYRRMDEEREKQRQSIESGRPSMDSITRAGNIAKSDIASTSVTGDVPEVAGGSRLRSSLEGDDSSESGRRLMPMLEPVKERKSEYGFDGFNVNDPALPGKFGNNNTVQDAPDLNPSHSDAEEARRHSISPKLPDLYRMSGFGLDLFSPTKTDSIAPNTSPETMAPREAPSNLTPTQNDPQLRNQPSLGFTSVVHQAFDRPSDASVPATPASNSGSAVKRSDSESTGTAGISPIISRVPSSAVAESRNRETSTPAILEAVDEPESPALAAEKGKRPQDTSSKQTQSVSAPFKPGHRRDISTPSPGNSPARSPDVSKVAELPLPETATITSAATSSLEDDEPLQPPRPIAEREHSFRPAMPGGWTSYATTARSTTPQAEGTQGSGDSKTAVTSDMPPPPRPPQKDEQELAANEHSSAHPALKGAAIAAIGGAAGLALDKHERGKTTAVSDEPAPIIRGNSELPTPDPSMAPSGNVYSTAKLDPRLTSLPPLERAPADTQLRPDAVARDISADSSAAPTPPPKDTPRAASEESSGYFPRPTAPLKEKSRDQAYGDEYMKSLMRPPILPTLSTDTKPYDEENDKLRKEIVKSLSPGVSNASPADHLLAPSDTGSAAPNRESTYLPSEYDNYWASTGDDEDPVPKRDSRESASALPVVAAAAATAGLGAKAATSASHPESSLQDVEPSRERARPLLPTRFSWEANSIAGDEPSFELAPNFPVPESNQAFSHSSTATIEPSKDNAPSFPVPESDQSFSHSSTAKIEPSNDNVILSEPVIPSEGSEVASTPERLPTEPDTSKEDHTARDAVLGAGAAVAAGGAYAAQRHHSQSQDTPQRRLSLAEEKAGGPNVSSYPVSPTPPEDEHPARSPQAYFASSADHPAELSGHGSVSPLSTTGKPPPSLAAKIPSFKEILSLKSPQERILAFDETRHRFATMDSGLGNFIVRLQTQHPEHSNLGASWGAPATSTRSKFSKGTGLGPQQAQQPYFQQYLNASSPGGPNPPIGAQASSTSTPTGTQQGLSPAGGKITTQNVQAKGKEFLHTAGVFGGKAGKAGKGLLAKGKNKLRGSGAGDKTTTPTSTSTPTSTPTSKSERRSSWGFPLSMTRSFGRSDGSPRNASRDSTPLPQRGDRQRSNTFTSSTGSPKASLHRAAASTNSMGMDFMAGGAVVGAGAGALLASRQKETHPLPDAASSVYTPTHTQTTQTPSPHVEVQNPLDTSDMLAVRPTPISKSQPSWDPFNATPIFEEEAYLHEEQAPQKDQAEKPREAEEGKLAVPRGDVSGRNSEETQGTPFYDAPEDPMDSIERGEEGEEWVMVDNEPVAENDAAETPRQHEQEVKELEHPEIPQKDEAKEPEHTDANLPSILNRPRGSSDVPGVVPVFRPRTSDSLPRPPTQSKVEEPGEIAQILSSAPAHTSIEQKAPETSASQSFLPPIRRSTTFGVGFGLGDGDGDPKSTYTGDGARRSPWSEKPLPQPAADSDQHSTGHHGTEIAAVAGAAALAVAVNSGRSKEDNLPRIPAAEPREDPQPQQYRSQGHYPGLLRPPLIQAGSSEYSQASQQGTLPPQNEAGINPPRAAEHPQNGFRRSQDAWRPNAIPTSSYGSKWGDDYVNVPRYSFEQSQRPSLEYSRPRGHSASSSTGQRLSGYIPRPDVPRPDMPRPDMPRPELPTPPKSFEQPPSSAQRYPGLFQPVPAPDIPQGNADLPDHYYQAPLGREEVFLPRTQTNEYQLPGVGPPDDESRSAGGKRNSGFFRELGGRLSRGTSRERNSISRDGEMQSPTRRLDSRGYPESSVTSDDPQERGKRRSSFLGALRRTSISGAEPPQSRESTIAHHAGSRTDLLLSGEPSPVKKEDRKRSFFGSSSGKPNKLSRASTSNVDESRKKRFSGLSGFFGKAGQQKSRDSLPDQRPQATRELSYDQRQPLESPQFGNRQPDVTEPRQYHPVPQTPRSLSQSRNVLTKISTNLNSNSTLRQDSRNRRPSGSGLLSGLMGRRSQKQHRDRDDSSSSGTQQPVHQVPPAQTYTDLQEQQAHEYSGQNNIGAIPWQEVENQPPERGRRVSRPLPQEPTYDSVPIPGEYSLVRGQGAMTVPTDYDPRGLAHLSQSQRYYPPANTNGYRSPAQPYAAQTNTHPSRNVGSLAMESHEPYHLPAVPRNLEYDEDAGRSPDSQQRPYQLALPGEEPVDREEYLEPPMRAPVQQTVQMSLPQQQQRARPHHPVIHRLQTQNATPNMHNSHSHLSSPAEYALPPSTANSPLPGSSSSSRISPFQSKSQYIPPAPFPPSPSAAGPVPPPKSPTRFRSTNQPAQNQTLDIQRSSTHRTALSDVSQLSNENGPPNPQPQTQPQSQFVPPPHPVHITSREIDPANTDGDTISSAPPTPPPSKPTNPNTGPTRAPSLPLRALNQQAASNGSNNLGIRETLIERGPSPDLYDATPRGVKTFGEAKLSPAPKGLVGRQGGSPLAGKGVGDGEVGKGGVGIKEEGGGVRKDGDEDKDDDEDEAGMSATSYPGQEWNPYLGGHEDWED